MSSRPTGPLARAAIALALGVAVLAVQAIQPLTTAHAQTLATRPTHLADPIPPKTRPVPWSAKTATPDRRDRKAPDAAALRRQALAQAAATEKIGSYRVSPAFLTFLSTGLGLRLEPSTLFTGVRAGSALRIGLPAPQGLKIDGIQQPAFGRSTLIIDQATGAATLTATGKGTTLTVTVLDAAAATMAGLSGDLTLSVPVLGETTTLSGAISYRSGTAVSVELSGHLTSTDDLKAGIAELDAGTTVTATPSGLEIAGPATLGPRGHQLGVSVSGVISGKSGWTLTVRAADGTTPLPGLALGPKATGTVTGTHGRISFEVQAQTAKPWTAAKGTAESGTVTVADGRFPSDKLVPAPGIAATTPWIDITGSLTASGVTSRGAAAINLASGAGLLTTTGATPVTLATRTGKLIHDDGGFRATLDISPAGRVVAKLPAKLSAAAPRDGVTRAVATPRYVRQETSANGTYTLSNDVYDFLTNTLNVPLGSATLSGSLSGSTLTVSVGAPTALPSTLPSWIPAPSYVTTQLTVDESSGTLTLTATGGTASLTVTITSGLSVSGSLALTSVPFTGGSTASLTFGLGYAGGALTASLTGSLTSAATFANGTVTVQPGAALTLATGSGLTLSNGVADITAGSNTTSVAVNGTLTDLSDWSFTVSDATADVWQPATGLSITPDFTGTIADNAGTVGFDLTSTGTDVATWVSPDAQSMVAVTSVEVSNQAPSSTASCSSPQVKTGDLWVGIAGGFTYSPTSLTASATGCLDLTGKSATITATAAPTEDLFSGGLPFTVTDAALTASVASSGAYSLTGTGTVTITQGVSGDPTFNVGLLLSNSGIVAGVSLPDLSSLGFSGSGALYVSTSVIDNFAPASLNLTGQPDSVDLPAGLAVSLEYTLPSSVTSQIAKIIQGFSTPPPAQLMASLSDSGFTVSLGVTFGTGTNGLTVFNSNGSAFYLDGVTLSVTVDNGDSSVSLSGMGYLQLAPIVQGGMTSYASVTVTGSFDFSSDTLSLSFDLADWRNAFSVQDLDVQDFKGSLGVTAGAPIPSLSISGKNIMLPAKWNSAIGLVQGTQISFGASLSITNPAVSFSLVNPNGTGPNYPVLMPLAVDGNQSQTVIDSFQVDQATFSLAPTATSLIFGATVDGVVVNVDASVNLTTQSVNATASVSSFTVGPVQFSGAQFFLNTSPSLVGFGFMGGASYNGDSFNAKVSLALGGTAAGAMITLGVTGGLPSYFQGGLSLTGTVSGDGSGASVNASGSGWLSAGGATLGPVSFSLSIPGGLSWSDASNSVTQLAQFFVNAGLSPSQVVQAVEQFGYSFYDAFNALSDIGYYGQTILSDLAGDFGFSSTYYNIWDYTSSGEILNLDVNGGSQAPNANVINWTHNGGYNQDWAFVQSPYPGYYEIVNRGSGQCLTVYGNNATPGNPLIQYPCAGASNQLWYLGNIALNTDYYIWSALDSEVVDVQNAYPWPGGYLDQWTYNGGWNQQFWLTNSTN